MDKYLSRLNTSGWLQNVADVLNCACIAAQCVDREGIYYYSPLYYVSNQKLLSSINYGFSSVQLFWICYSPCDEVLTSILFFLSLLLVIFSCHYHFQIRAMFFDIYSTQEITPGILYTFLEPVPKIFSLLIKLHVASYSWCNLFIFEAIYI